MKFPARGFLLAAGVPTVRVGAGRADTLRRRWAVREKPPLRGECWAAAPVEGRPDWGATKRFDPQS